MIFCFLCIFEWVNNKFHQNLIDDLIITHIIKYDSVSYRFIRIEFTRKKLKDNKKI